jgi:hypothetical protein
MDNNGAPLPGTHARCGDGRAGQRWPVRRWPADGPELVREPGLPAASDEGGAVVAKFYRPNRWSDAQILEEHSFSLELMAAEVPVVGPLVLGGATLHQFGGFVIQRQPAPGRASARAGRSGCAGVDWPFFGAHSHGGCVKPFAVRPALNLQNFGQQSREWLLAHDMAAARCAIAVAESVTGCSRFNS